MPSRQKEALSNYRRRLKRRGIVRLEVQVHKADAPLVRSLAAALIDPDRGAKTRALLRERFPAHEAQGLKALLAAAPLEGIDLDRDRDAGRPIDL